MRRHQLSDPGAGAERLEVAEHGRVVEDGLGRFQQLLHGPFAFGYGGFPHLGALQFGVGEADAAVALAHQLPRGWAAVLAEVVVGRTDHIGVPPTVGVAFSLWAALLWPACGRDARAPRQQAIAVPQPRNRRKNPCSVRLSTHFNDFLTACRTWAV